MLVGAYPFEDPNEPKDFWKAILCEIWAREFTNELRASTKASRNPTVWLEVSFGSGHNVNAAHTSTVSEAYGKMLTIFIPLLVDESFFFVHFMCFEVPALVPPSGVNGGKSGYAYDANDDNDLGDDNKSGKNSAELATLNESLQDSLDRIQMYLCLIQEEQ